MEENYRYQLNNNNQQITKPSRLGLRPTRTGGEIVEVQGGHIVRSTGLKDRHSKVCTAKGPRDRRVRLSANTAIQFYDVQDRLGYDRPSKAVDWLIKKAKAAIDELDELPAWTPTAGKLKSRNVDSVERNPNFGNVDYCGLREMEDDPDEDIVDGNMGRVQNSNFVPGSVDLVKSLFPTTGSGSGGNGNDNGNGNGNGNGNDNGNNNIYFGQNQDLKLSLQSLQDGSTDDGNNNVCYDGGLGWPESGAYVFNSVPMGAQTTPYLQPLFGQPMNNQLLLNYISQRGPLQSSNSPSVRAWVDPLQFGAGIDPGQAQAQTQTQTMGFSYPFSVPGFYSGNPGMGGFSGFGVQARIQGEEEEHASSGSSDSRH